MLSVAQHPRRVPPCQRGWLDAPTGDVIRPLMAQVVFMGPFTDLVRQHLRHSLSHRDAERPVRP